MSTVHYCDHCESQCSTDCEQTPQCGSTVLWCIRSVPTNSSKEESMKNVDGFIFDNNVSVEWIEPTPSQASPQYLSSQVNHQLCLCNGTIYTSQCNSSSEEGVYKCIIKGSNVTETLQFTYSVYKINTVPSTSTTSAPENNVIITSSSYQTMKPSTTLSTIIATTTTTTKTTTNSPSIDTSCSLSSLHVTACPSSNQDSTIPYYGGIGLLAITNLLTLIVLVTSCVYIIHSKKQTK